jgi:hypothetical protein
MVLQAESTTQSALSLSCATSPAMRRSLSDIQPSGLPAVFGDTQVCHDIRQLVLEIEQP